MRVQKGNVQYKIHEEQVEGYLAQGFDLIDEKGEVLKRATSMNADEAIGRLSEQAAEITKLTRDLETAEAKVKDLQDENKELKKELKALQALQEKQ